MNRIFFPQRMVAGKFKINILEDSAFNEDDFPNIQHFPAEASHGSRQKAIIWHDFYESSWLDHLPKALSPSITTWGMMFNHMLRSWEAKQSWYWTIRFQCNSLRNDSKLHHWLILPCVYISAIVTKISDRKKKTWGSKEFFLAIASEFSVYRCKPGVVKLCCPCWQLHGLEALHNDVRPQREESDQS